MRRKGGERRDMSGGGLQKKGIIFLRVLLDSRRVVEFCIQEGLVQGASVCWGFWARGPGYPLISWS